jgi:hypothetical protein
MGSCRCNWAGIVGSGCGAAIDEKRNVVFWGILINKGILSFSMTVTSRVCAPSFQIEQYA